MGYLTLLVLIVVCFIIYSWWADSNEKRNAERNERRHAEELRKIVEEDNRQYIEIEKKKQEEDRKANAKHKKELKPMQDRIKIFLKTHPGETFSENELRKHLGITTASENSMFQSALRCAVDDYGWKGKEYADTIEGVIVSYSDGQHYAYYVDPKK